MTRLFYIIITLLLPATGMDFYHSNETYQTMDPFAWNLYGSFSPAFYGFSLPFSFVITQYSKSYTTPFTQLGISSGRQPFNTHKIRE